MSPNGSGPRLSRRRVLTGLTGLGAVASVGGTSGLTRSGYVDTETFDTRLRGGVLDLVVDWERAGETGTADGPTVALPLAALGPDRRSGDATLTVGLPGDENNPARVWFRADCATPLRSILAEHIQVTVEVRACPGETVLDSYEGSLREVADALRGGVPLGDTGCLDPDDTRCVDVSWRLDDDYAGSETIAWPFTFVAEQCRYDATPTNPFAGVDDAPCPAFTCECCVRVGKLEPSNNYLTPGVYDFDEGTDDYRLQVTETVDKSDGGGAETVGIAFTLVDADGEPGPALCRVEMVAANTTATYDLSLLGAPDASTGSVLYTPPKVSDPAGPGDYYGLSHVTVSVCAPETDGECPPDLVKKHEKNTEHGKNTEHTPGGGPK
ncbi:MAG: hypothetical protein ABEJ06_01860 [Haloarculaceae archaeon]